MSAEDLAAYVSVHNALICRKILSYEQTLVWVHLMNNRMGKTRDLFKKIRDTKGTFHAKMGLIKDRNGMDLTEAKYIKKRWQQYTEELYKKDLHLHNPHNHNAVITHLESDILECGVKWALESILRTKLVEVMEFQLSYFKS